MKRSYHWWLWPGLLLAVVAFLSYFMFFARFAATRDVPWVNFLLFVAALVLLVTAWRRAPRKILASIVTVLGLLIFGTFTYMVTLGSKDLPAAAGAPAVGAKAPDFALPDTSNRPVALSQLLSQSNGVLLVFYRGHW